MINKASKIDNKDFEKKKFPVVARWLACNRNNPACNKATARTTLYLHSASESSGKRFWKCCALM